MAHEIATIEGQQTMFSVRETPWHGLGKVVHDAPTVKDAIKLAGLDWDVEISQVFDDQGNSLHQFGKLFYRTEQLPDGTKQRVPLGIVGAETHPYQNAEGFEWFNEYVDKGLCTLETAGALRGGKLIWILAKLKGDNTNIVGNDEVSKFLMISNSHDGTQSVRVGFTPIRVVCANTLAMAHGDKSKASKLLRIRHSKKVKSNVDLLKENIDIANQQFEMTAERYRFLASRGVNAADLRKFVKLVLEVDKEDKDIKTRTMGQIEEIEDRFESGLGNNMEGVRGSWWAAYNAVTEWLNYARGQTRETRLNSLWFGNGAKDNERALELAIQAAEGKLPVPMSAVALKA